MRKVSLIASILLLPTTALACASKESVVFSCLTTNRKAVEVCDAGDHLRYSFGRPNSKAELAFSVERSKASTDQWQGIGRYIGYAVNLPHADMVYSVYFGSDRLTGNHEVEAGIHVSKAGNLLATVLCKANTLEQHLEEIDLMDEANDI